MSEIFDEIHGHAPMQQVWAGVVATNPVNYTSRISVVIPNLDPNTRFENCRWQSRDDVSLPFRGNSCLCIFDDNNEVWVVCWWPF